jgi:hypothetical protein
VRDAPPLACALVLCLERAIRVAELRQPGQQLRRRRANIAKWKGDAARALCIGARDLNAQAPDASAVLDRCVDAAWP